MVDVNWGGIARAAKALGGEGTNIITVKAATACDRDVLEAALPPDNGDSPANGGWFTGPTGWLLLIEGLDEQVNPWLEDLAARLSAAGVEGTLTGAGSVGQPLWAQRMREKASLHGLVGFRTRSEFHYYDGWVGDDATSDAAIRLGMDWLTAHGGKIMSHPDMRANFWTEPAAASQLMTRDVTRSGLAHATNYHQQRLEVRSASVQSPATLCLSTATAEYPWQQMVDELRAGLLATPMDLVSVAMVSTRNGLAEHEPDAEGNCHSHAYEWHPERWGDLICEPCGIQVLTDRHLAAAQDLSAWRTTRVDETHVLVEARDLGPWYAAPRHPMNSLDPDLLSQARRDFGEMILTAAKAEELRLDTKPPRRQVEPPM